MNSDINKYLALQAALINEKAKLEARLGEISRVLGQDVSAPAASPAPTAPTTTTKGKRTFSAATRAKMKASQQARWAKKKGIVAVKAIADAAPAPAAKKAGRKLSEETKAKMRAAHQARWAKKKGNAAAPTTAVASAAPKKAKRVISPEAKARMIAGAKKRWAKVNAAKKAA